MREKKREQNSEQQAYRKGFTLIEVMIVVAIIGILTATVSVSLQAARLKSQAVQGLTDIQRIALSIETYKANYGTYPLSCGTGGAWASRNANPWGCGLGACWIPEFATETWCPLPSNLNQPPPGIPAAQSQYLYYSNATGTDYKLLYHQPVSRAVPVEFIDPLRSTWAFGIWSPGGIGF
jgi:prepilin-type N-terminal cleavage/methylation domain-containing protein